MVFIKKLLIIYAIFGVAGVTIFLLYMLEGRLPWRPWRVLFVKTNPNIIPVEADVQIRNRINNRLDS